MTGDDRERLRAALAAPGFDVVRFAAIGGGTAPAGGLHDWLAAGHHADMNWMPGTAAKRADPNLVLSGARTMIVLGVNYRPADPDAQSQQRWAKYALWSDYHDTIGRGLRAAGTVLETQLGLTREDYRAYVDTGPVLERGWSAAAGLGWQGKNGMLISRQYGNWLFLATILVRVEIPVDEPLGSNAGPDLLSVPSAREEAARTQGPALHPENQPAVAGLGEAGPGSMTPATGEGAPSLGLHCGTCTRCLTACPTEAFPRPGWVDARRCIAYHTIENRGLIPRELRSKFGGRVFGCDECLDVCPWNRFAREARSALLVARHELVGLTLLDLLTMDVTRFRTVFRQSPIKRVKLPGLLRNACIAAGNWHDSREWHFGGGENQAAVADAVQDLCTHESAIVRAHAVWALRRLVGDGEALARLAEVGTREQDEQVLAEYA